MNLGDIIKRKMTLGKLETRRQNDGKTSIPAITKLFQYLDEKIFKISFMNFVEKHLEYGARYNQGSYRQPYNGSILNILTIIQSPG